ncbi:Hint domain-containing protein [Thermodesulfobacteriota bacterium]
MLLKFASGKAIYTAQTPAHNKGGNVMFALRGFITSLVLSIVVTAPSICLSDDPPPPPPDPIIIIDLSETPPGSGLPPGSPSGWGPPPAYPPGSVPPPAPPEPSAGKTLGRNEDGFEVKEYKQTTETGQTVVYYGLFDPVTKKTYPAVRAGNTFTMSEMGAEEWRSDRGYPTKQQIEYEKKRKEREKQNGEEDTDVGCFFADTKVLMGDGRSLAISRVSEGDIVKSYNTEKGVVENKKVMKTYTFPSEGYYLINGSIKATAKHPFLMAGPGEVWKKATELRLGDRVRAPEGQITVDSIEKVVEKGKSYNFRVADNKAYVVSGLDKLYVVHNGL